MKCNERLPGFREVLLVVGLAALAPAAEAQTATEAALSESLQQIDEYCVTCHNFDDFAGGLDLTGILDEPLPQEAETWEKVIRKLRAGMMPPPGQPRPAWNDYVALTSWLEDEIDKAAEPYPGTVMMHRLNRSEYANVIRDLLGLEIDPTTLLQIGRAHV